MRRFAALSARPLSRAARSAVLLAVVALSALGGCGHDPGARPGTSGAPDPALVAGCPPPTTSLPWPPDGRLPPGATTVRLCDVPDVRVRPRADLHLQPPGDALTTRVAPLVDLVDRLPHSLPHGYYCAGVGAPDSAFWFGYPDGREYAVVYENGGCSTFVGPHVQRVDGERLQRGFVAALRAQRATRTPPPPTERPTCRWFEDQPRSTITDAGSLPLVSAVACRVSGRSAREAVLTPDQLALVNADVHLEPAATTRPSCAEPSTATGLVGLDAWGDLLVLDGGSCGVLSVPTLVYDGAHEQVWPASSAVQRMLAGLDYGPREPAVHRGPA